MRKYIEYKEIENSQNFWKYFVATSFPESLVEEKEMTIIEIMMESGNFPEEEWVYEFTQSYDGVFEESDGYIDTPTSIKVEYAKNRNLVIEFQPGDSVYFINEEIFGATGPDYKIKQISWVDFCEYRKGLEDKVAFLLFPMVYINDSEIEELKSFVNKVLDSLGIKDDDIFKGIISNYID